MSSRAERNAKYSNKYTVKDEIFKTLNGMFDKGKGRSKNNCKNPEKYIFSSGTYETYKKQCKTFANWAKEYEKTSKLKHLKDLKPFVDDYLQSLIDRNLSAWTIKTAKSALVKLYQADADDFICTPPRNREDIKRSRFDTVRDYNVGKKTFEFYSMLTSSTGLRRSELCKIKGTDLIEKNGKYYIHVHKGAKGGRERYALIVGKNDQETQEVVDLFKSKRHLNVVPNVPSCFDNHRFRAEYAKRVYFKYLRDIDTLTRKERYYCRKDLKGQILDRKAMQITSENLGHSRLTVIAQSYLY